jgi:hypothetical protein
MKLILSLAIFLLMPFLTRAVQSNNAIDLSHHNFVDDPVTSLRGEWEFYWNQLLTPEDFATGKYANASRIHVPQSWQRANSAFSTLGYGTYRTTVILPDDSTDKSIYLPFVCSSAVIWINGKLAGKAGVVGKTAEEFKGRLKTTVIPLTDHVRKFEIIIQVSNFTYFSGGLVASPQVAETTALLSDISRAKGINNALIGCLVAMFIYHIILFFL